MSPSDSKNTVYNQRGFTLLEVLVVVAVSLILGIVVVRFYRDSYHTYSMQEQVEERNQNANFTVSKMVEVLQQAGSELPDTGWSVLKYSLGVLTVGANPKGVKHFVSGNPGSSNLVAINDASGLRSASQPLLNATHILLDSVGAKGIKKYSIDTNCAASGFTNGLKVNDPGIDSVCLVDSIDLNTGDWVYGYREDQYLIATDSLVIRPNGDATQQIVLSENIDSLGLTFRNRSGTTDTLWKNMRSVSISVRAKTSKRDPRIPAPGFHFITLPMNVILRNKV
jgi:prepilin-type N-terminal cleavage/methylation domain-containing protein